MASQMRELTVIENAAIAITGDRFAWVGSAGDWSGTAARTIDLGGRAVVPGLVDPHTHAVWAGDRLGDFDAADLRRQLRADTCLGWRHLEHHSRDDGCVR